MANIKSIGGNPIVLGLDGLTDDAKATLGNPKLSATSESILGTTDTAQWAQRVTNGSGASTVRSVQGVSVVWAQLNDNNANSATVSGVTFTKNSDGSWTADGTATADIQKYIVTGLAIVGGHSYLVKGCPAGGGANAYSLGISNVKIDTGAGGIYTIMSSATGVDFILNVSNGQTLNNLVFTPQLFDLTAMFGAGNEPTTVAEFEAMYPEAYYPYSAPTLKPVQIAGFSSTDANGNALDSVEWPAQTLRAVGSVADELTAGELVTRVGVATIDPSASGVTFEANSTPNDAGLYNHIISYTSNAWSAFGLSNAQWTSGNYLVRASANSTLGVSDASAMSSTTHAGIQGNTSSRKLYLRWPSLLTEQQFAALIATGGNSEIQFALASPTTQTISPALPMTYRVEQGGTEAIIVPTGEVSAPPVLTVADGESAGEVVMDALACIAAPDGPVATANHALGTYLTMQGKLYKVTSAIAAGETITAGTNVTVTTVMDEILALN